jgi:diguanylate cyclase (GGDEF)-like protein
MTDLSAGPARRRNPILSIRTRLTALAVLVVAPLMLDRVRGLEASRAEHVQKAHAAVVELARRGGEAQREIVLSVRAILQVMARTLVLTAGDGETCAGHFADFTDSVPWIRGMSIVGSNGRIACSTTPAAAGLDVSDRPYYQAAVRGNGLVLSDYLIGRARQSPAVMAAVPARAADGTLQGVVVASIDLKWISGLLATISRHEGAALVVVDGRGAILAATQQPWIGQRYAGHPLVAHMRANGEGTLTAKDFDGVRRIFAYERVPLTDAWLAVGLDENAVLSRIDRDIDIAYLQFALLGVLVLLVAWFGGERLIVQPIRALARTAARFGRGDLHVRVTQERWLPEFEPLAVALDDMAAKLAEREEELRIANRHLEELASLDGLSGLANRRGFDLRLEAEWQQARKLQRPLALMMIDIDHFKKFNDRYGHVEGDACLRAVGDALSMVTLNDAVLVARYGGEEFALLLPNRDYERVAMLAEEARQAVADLEIPHADAPCGHVTISIGFASLVPQPGEPAARLVEAADAGLYVAKARGRDCVAGHAAATLVAA